MAIWRRGIACILSRVAMAQVRIKRGGGRHFRMPSASRALLGLALLALPASCIQSLAGARTPLTNSGAVVSIALDAPRPFNPAVDPMAMLQPVVAAVDPVTTGSIDPLTAEIATTFVMPEASAFSAGPAAAPYVFRGRNATDTLRASLCLTAAIYYEAANEPDEGQRAVAQVVLNRVRHPAWPDTVCDVVYQGTERLGTLCQFTFGCDGAMARAPSLAGWVRARRVAQAALAGYVHAPAGLATHYHTLAVSPSWGKTLTPVGIYGAHIFYRLPGGAGAPRAFYDSYRGNEPTPGPRAKIGLPADPLIFATAGTVMPQELSAAPSVAGAVEAPPPPPPANIAADRRYVAGSLPESDVRDEYRNSGQWIAR
jgi:spore germination cell wall hydrolase CwlJ-like protein